MDFLDFIRKTYRERKERGLVQKGGEGSGWFGPPEGTHTAEGGEVKPKIHAIKLGKTIQTVSGLKRKYRPSQAGYRRLQDAMDILSRARYADASEKDISAATKIIEVVEKEGISVLAVRDMKTDYSIENLKRNPLFH